MTMPPLLAQSVAAVLAAATAWAFDRSMARRGFKPPGFALPQGGWRWGLSLALVAAVVYLVGFSSLLGWFGPPPPARDFATLSRFDLFALQGILVLVLLAWHGLGFWGVGWSGREEGVEKPAAFAFARQYGLAAERPLREIGLGIALGLITWALVLVAVLVVYLVVAAVFGEDVLPKKPPDAIPYLATLPFFWRLGLALSAGVVEELFFRGFLQPRVGILASTALFAAAHLGYGQPFMLVGITILSLFYAGIVRWRQSVWAAIAAHATFDAVQILIVIPALLKFL